MDLSMPLSYRIASMRAMASRTSSTGTPLNIDNLVERVELEAKLISQATKLRLDNVAAYLCSQGSREWHFDKDIPNWSPPYELFFAEWSRVAAGTPYQAGMLAASVDVTDDNRADVEGWFRSMELWCGSPGDKSRASRDMVSAALSESRWVMFTSMWESYGGREVKGHPVWMGVTPVFFIGPEGQMRLPLFLGVDMSFYDKPSSPPLEGAAVLGMGVSFCHCKNVRNVESEESRPGNWHVNTGVPVYKYRTLHIDPMKETLRREGRSEEVGLARALHICRGHFATYSEDAPLFGRYSGTFWKPQHVRGKASAGAVVKDYSVSPGGS